MNLLNSLMDWEQTFRLRGSIDRELNKHVKEVVDIKDHGNIK